MNIAMAFPTAGSPYGSPSVVPEAPFGHAAALCRATPEVAEAGLAGEDLKFCGYIVIKHGDLMGFYSDLMGFYSDLMGF